MFVFVLNKNGEPLMPCKPQKARKLLAAGKAKVVTSPLKQSRAKKFMPAPT